MRADELGVFLQDADLAAAMAMAERIRAAISALAFSFAPLAAPDAREAHVQAKSIGVAPAIAGASRDALLHNADALLYEAKGRNRVATAS